MKDLAKATLAHKVCAAKEDDLQQEVRLTTQRQAIYYWLATHATENVFAEFKADIISFKQLEGMYAVRYAEVPWEQVLPFDHV